MKKWIGYTLISVISLVIVGGTTFGVQYWAYAQGIKEIKAGGPLDIKNGLGHLELAKTFGSRDSVPGYSEFQDKLGVFYNQGQGVHQYYAQAVRWFRKAANNGYPKSQNNLGVCYLGEIKQFF